jgi:nicotinamidase-related amidase
VIAPEDVITDNGVEVNNLLAQHGIENVIMMGVHTNMCVVGRPFGLRRLVEMGKNVVLARDLTDAMYNPERAPFVSHVQGTALVVAHIEAYICPSITSTDLTGAPPFRFREDMEVAN